jgi:hypothetical protein
MCMRRQLIVWIFMSHSIFNSHFTFEHCAQNKNKWNFKQQEPDAVYRCEFNNIKKGRAQKKRRSLYEFPVLQARFYFSVSLYPHKLESFNATEVWVIFILLSITIKSHTYPEGVMPSNVILHNITKQAIILYTCIWEVIWISAGYRPSWHGFRGFPYQTLPANAGTVPWNKRQSPSNLCILAIYDYPNLFDRCVTCSFETASSNNLRINQ